jgi:tetratricopeptide (TPR) repeat protein
LAQWWVADYYYGQDKPQEAESNYRLVFQNWPASSLAYPARMMAGRVAGAVRQDWDQAAEYFLSLQNDTNCPVNLRAQALYAYGDTLLSRNNTNKGPDYVEAFKVFDLVCTTYPTNRLAALAWGQKAICMLQSARSSDDYLGVTKAFQEVINSPYADATARSIAEVGLGVIVEKIAASKPEPEKSKLLDEARGHYQRVFVYDGFLRPGEKPDPFWTRKAGMEEARLAEALHMREHAVRVYQRLQEMFPPERLDDKIKALQAQEH